MDSNHRPVAYEATELPLLHPATTSPLQIAVVKRPDPVRPVAVQVIVTMSAEPPSTVAFRTESNHSTSAWQVQPDLKDFLKGHRGSSSVNLRVAKVHELHPGLASLGDRI